MSSWTETSTKGVFTRTLDNSEFLCRNVAYPLKAITNREHWSINPSFELQLNGTSDLIDALKRAWINLRYQVPILAAVLDDDRTLTYTVPNSDEELEKWLAASFHIHQEGSVDTFMDEVRWYEYCSLHYFSTTSRLLMRTHHWLNDGTGSLHLANKFFQLLVEDAPAPKFGDEVSRLSPSFVEAAQLPTEITPRVEEKAQERFLTFLSQLPSVGLAASNLDRLPEGTRCVTVPFEADVLPILLAGCKKHGISLASAVHAAISVTLFEMAGPESPQSYTTVGNFSYRKYLPAPYNDTEKWPMGLWMLGLPITVPEADFATTVKIAQAAYKQPLESNLFPDWDSYDHYAGKMAYLIGAPPPPGFPMPTNPPLSSLGLIESFIKHEYKAKLGLSIGNFEFWPDVMLPTPVVYQWSWKGILYINTCYNVTHYSQDYIKGFIQKIQKNLVDGVGSLSTNGTAA